jgi:UDP-N-acetylglucosamine 2-epimerase
MYDAVLTFSEIASNKINLSDIVDFNENQFILATIHRPSNTDNLENLDSILSAFKELDIPIIWPVHPRNKKRLSKIELPSNLHLLDPVSYLEMMTLLKHCKLVLTDSGGLQKEAYWLQKQCITLREETEWVETLEGGWNRLTGANKSKIIIACTNSPETDWKPLYGKGKASEEIVAQIKTHFSL